MSENTLPKNLKDTDKNKYPSSCQNLLYCGLCKTFFPKGLLSTGDHLISDNHFRCFGINELDSRDKRWNKFKSLCNHNVDFLTKHLHHGFSKFIEENIFSKKGLYDSKLKAKKFKIKIQRNQINVSLYSKVFREIEKFLEDERDCDDENITSDETKEFESTFFDYNYQTQKVTKLKLPNVNPILSNFTTINLKKRNPRRIKEKKIVPNYYSLYQNLLEKNILPDIKPNEKRVLCNTTFLHYLCNNSKFNFIISKAIDGTIIINNVIPNNRFWNLNDIGCILENKIIGSKKDIRKRTYKITKFNVNNINLFVISEVDCAYRNNDKIITVEIKSRKGDRFKKISQKNFVQLYSLQANFQYEYLIRDEGNSYSINKLEIRNIKEEMEKRKEKLHNIQLKIRNGIERIFEYQLPYSINSS